MRPIVAHRGLAVCPRRWPVSRGRLVADSLERPTFGVPGTVVLRADSACYGQQVRGPKLTRGRPFYGPTRPAGQHAVPSQQAPSSTAATFTTPSKRPSCTPRTSTAGPSWELPSAQDVGFER